jgi:hypothetical protein
MTIITIAYICSALVYQTASCMPMKQYNVKVILNS